MKKRLVLIWLGIEVIRTVPMTEEEREIRSANWRLSFGKNIQIVEV